jgi:hypothetical protein
MKTHFWSYFKFIMMNYYRDFLHIFIMLLLNAGPSLYEQHSRFTFFKAEHFESNNWLYQQQRKLQGNDRPSLPFIEYAV